MKGWLDPVGLEVQAEVEGSDPLTTAPAEDRA